MCGQLVIVAIPGHTHLFGGFLNIEYWVGKHMHKNNVSRIRKYYNHTLQTNPRHVEEESQSQDISNTNKLKQRVLYVSIYFNYIAIYKTMY